MVIVVFGESRSELLGGVQPSNPIPKASAIRDPVPTEGDAPSSAHSNLPQTRQVKHLHVFAGHTFQ